MTNEDRLREDRERRDRVASTSSISSTLSPAPTNTSHLRTDGPTLAEFVAAGYKAEDYPPEGLAPREEATAAVPVPVPEAGKPQMLKRTTDEKGFAHIEGQTGGDDHDLHDVVTPGNQHMIVGAQPVPVEVKPATPRIESTPANRGLILNSGEGVAEQVERLEGIAENQDRRVAQRRSDTQPIEFPNDRRVAPADRRVNVGPGSVAGPDADFVPVSESEPTVEKFEGQGVDETSAALKQGHLPEDFPGYAALQEAGEATYAKVRRRIVEGTLTEVSGIGESTASKIEEAMAAVE
jgi:hypothetical protein